MYRQLLILFLAISIFSSCKKDERAVPQVESIKMNEAEATLTVGESLSLTISHFPENLPAPDCVWSTDNPKVLNVQSDGSMIALHVGKATVTVKTLDSRLSTSCTVNVIPVDANGITLNKTSLKLVLSGSETLSYTISPPSATNKEVIWTSLNSDIAVVDQLGKVTAMSVGETEIEVISKDGKVKTTCKVVVEPVLASGISLNRTALDLLPGEMETLTYTIDPVNTTDKTVQWKSSDIKVAEVDSKGSIVARGVGEAVIEVITSDGRLKASCKVTVKPILVTSLSISKSTVSLVVGESSQLSVSILPLNASNKSVTWSSSNSSIATVDADGTVTAVGVGNAEVIAKSENGKIALSSISVKDPFLAVNGYTVGGMIFSSSVTYTLGIYFVNETSVDAIVKNVKVKNATGTTLYSGDMNESVKRTTAFGEQIVSLTSQGNFLNSWTVEITYTMQGKSQKYVMNVGKSR